MSEVQTTQSADKLASVVVESRGAVSDVWLNRNIKKVTVKLDEGKQTMWEAEQVHFLMNGVPEVAELEASFDELWAEHAGVEPTVAELSDAIAELSVLVSDLMGE